MSSDEDVNSGVLAAIKEVHKNPIPPSREDIIEHVLRPIYMGFPKTLPAKARGRKPKSTQYDVWFERRKLLYQKLVRLPNLRKGTAGYGFSDQILAIARLIPNSRERVTAVQMELQRRGLPSPDKSNLRKFLRKNNL